VEAGMVPAVDRRTRRHRAQRSHEYAQASGTSSRRAAQTGLGVGY
jgi:hypothetical protein